jgi:hypothetical protein
MKQSYLLLLGIVLMFLQNSTNAQSKDSLISQPLNNLNVQPILVINAFDAMTISARVKKKELFKELTDSLKLYLSNEILLQTGRQAKIADDILAANQNLDSNVRSRMQLEHAEFSIVILSLNAFFNQSQATRVTDFEGKDRTWVSIDLCATNLYYLYSADTILKLPATESCKFLTKRESKTGNFFSIAISPDIAGKRKHTYGVVELNAQRYITSILPFLAKKE